MWLHSWALLSQRNVWFKHENEIQPRQCRELTQKPAKEHLHLAKEPARYISPYFLKTLLGIRSCCSSRPQRISCSMVSADIISAFSTSMGEAPCNIPHKPQWAPPVLDLVTSCLFLSSSFYPDTASSYRWVNKSAYNPIICCTDNKRPWKNLILQPSNAAILFLPRRRLCFHPSPFVCWLVSLILSTIAKKLTDKLWGRMWFECWWKNPLSGYRNYLSLSFTLLDRTFLDFFLIGFKGTVEVCPLQSVILVVIMILILWDQLCSSVCYTYSLHHHLSSL